MAACAVFEYAGAIAGVSLRVYDHPGCDCATMLKLFNPRRYPFERQKPSRVMLLRTDRILIYLLNMQLTSCDPQGVY
jgi:hypothetical protein